MKKTNWQERYHDSEIYTLRCKVFDEPGMLDKDVHKEVALAVAGAYRK